MALAARKVLQSLASTCENLPGCGCNHALRAHLCKHGAHPAKEFILRFPFSRYGLVITAALLTSTAWTAAQAQQPATPASLTTATADNTAAAAAPSKGELKAMREFKMLDFNGDGQLSRKEVALIPRLASHFDEADTNHDGFVSYEEVKAFTVKYRAERDRQKAAAAAAASAATAKSAAATAAPAAASTATATAEPAETAPKTAP
jgi:hypothetical protein